MENNSSLVLINTLEEKFQLFLKKHIETEKLCQQLQRQNDELMKKLYALQKQLEQAEKEKTIQSLHMITDEQQKEQLKRYLDMLIKNLDDNIQLLK